MNCSDDVSYWYTNKLLNLTGTQGLDLKLNTCIGFRWLGFSSRTCRGGLCEESLRLPSCWTMPDPKGTHHWSELSHEQCCVGLCESRVKEGKEVLSNSTWERGVRASPEDPKVWGGCGWHTRFLLIKSGSGREVWCTSGCQSRSTHHTISCSRVIVLEID